MPGESKKISELESASSLNNGDLLELASVNALSETGYSSKKTTIADVANKIATLNPQAQADWTEADDTDPSYIQNKPALATVATSGSYNDLQDQPQIPAAQVNSDWNSVSGVSEILNKPTLGTAASKNTGVANGVAELDANGLVPTSQLPAYVDDVLEYASQSAFPATGETGKIYVALDTNLTYRWGGSAYVEISPSLALGETSSTAYAGNKGKANADAIAALQTAVGGLATVATSGSYTDLSNKPAIPDGLADLTDDVNISSPTDGQVLKYDGTSSKWVNGTGGGGGASALDDLSDVTITSPTAGQVLYFDGSKWINHEGGGSGGGSAQIDTLYSGTAVIGDVVPLSSAYTNYDMLMFRCYNTNMGGYFGSSWNVGSISINDSMLVGYATAGQDRRLIGTITSTTTFSIGASENGTQLKEIVGYKFGGGSNSVELTYAEYQALTPEQQLDGTEYFITDINGDGQQFQPIIYSEEEREIGVWTDGKPLYEKTLKFVNDTGWTAGTVFDTQISDVDYMFIKEANFTDTSVSGVGSLPYLQQGSPSDTLTLICSTTTKNQIVVKSNSGFTTNLDRFIIVTVRYTKTTDQAGSGTWTPQGVPAVHYSNDEQVVGTWVDGSTIYEQSFAITNQNISTGWTVLVSSVSIAKLISGEVCVSSSGYDYTWNALYYNNGNVAIYNFLGGAILSANGYLTIRYTKPST